MIAAEWALPALSLLPKLAVPSVSPAFAVGAVVVVVLFVWTYFGIGVVLAAGEYCTWVTSVGGHSKAPGAVSWSSQWLWETALGDEAKALSEVVAVAEGYQGLNQYLEVVVAEGYQGLMWLTVEVEAERSVVQLDVVVNVVM